VNSSLQNPNPILIPSKTFLIGEYAVLDHGQALIVAHQPCFQLHSQDTHDTTIAGIAAESPSMRLFHQQKILPERQLTFQDPHHGAGGFGASSAQFLSLLKQFGHCTSLPAVLDHFWHYHGTVPSGGDIACQALGGILQYQRHPLSATSWSWPFKELGFMLIATGTKVTTHEHLKCLNLSNTTDLHQLAAQGIQAFIHHDQRTWLTAIQDYQACLTSQQLSAPTTQALLQTFNATPWVLASKGCGAMGADVIVVFAKTEHFTPIKQLCQQLQLSLIATHLDIVTAAQCP
jgi:mevalonate kinase